MAAGLGKMVSVIVRSFKQHSYNIKSCLSLEKMQLGIDKPQMYEGAVNCAPLPLLEDLNVA
jgi:hypothetical protein